MRTRTDKPCGSIAFPVFELQPSDPVLTCVLCGLPRAELTVEVRTPGRLVHMGLHRSCFAKYTEDA